LGHTYALVGIDMLVFMGLYVCKKFGIRINITPLEKIEAKDELAVLQRFAKESKDQILILDSQFNKILYTNLEIQRPLLSAECDSDFLSDLIVTDESLKQLAFLDSSFMKRHSVSLKSLLNPLLVECAISGSTIPFRARYV